MISYINKNYYLILLILLSLFIFVPTFNLKFSWIDDGWDIQVARNLIDSFLKFDFGSITNTIVETNIGRFRPVYWLWQTTVYLIGGSSSAIHYFLHYILILSIALFVYRIIFHYTKSNASSFVGSLLLLVFPLNAENWVRLGPAEPLMIFFVIVAIYNLIVKENIKKATIFMLLALLTKESAVAVFPAFVFYFFLLLVTKNKTKNIFKFLVNMLFLSLGSILISLLNRKGYSNSYVFSFATSKYNFELYLKFLRQVFPAIDIFIGALILHVIRPIVNFKLSRIKEFDVVKILFLSLALLFVLVQAPWAWVLNRYLLPAVVMGSVFVGLEYYSISQFFKKYIFLNKLFGIFVFISLFIFSLSSWLKINEQIIRQRQSTNNVFLMLKRLAEITPQNGRIYFNFVDNDATMEPLFESDLHFKLFFNRHDIAIDFIENKPKNETDYLVISGTPLGSFPYFEESYFGEDKLVKKHEAYKNNNKFIVLSNFETVTKQIAKKLYQLVRNGKIIDGSGIYTDYLLKDTWSIYYY